MNPKFALEILMYYNHILLLTSFLCQSKVTIGSEVTEGIDLREIVLISKAIMQHHPHLSTNDYFQYAAVTRLR